MPYLNSVWSFFEIILYWICITHSSCLFRIDKVITPKSKFAPANLTKAVNAKFKNNTKPATSPVKARITIGDRRVYVEKYTGTKETKTFLRLFIILT